MAWFGSTGLRARGVVADDGAPRRRARGVAGALLDPPRRAPAGLVRIRYLVPCILAALAFPGGALASLGPPPQAQAAVLGLELTRASQTVAKRDYYVSPSGSDSGPGTRARPWRTIQRAVSALRPGRRVVVRAGVYRERVDVGRGGSAKSPVKIVAYPGERPVLIGRLKVDTDHVRVVGLVLDGTGGSAFDAALYISGARNVRILRCEIRNSTGSGVFVGDSGNPSRNVTLLRNWIHDNGIDDFHDHGIYWAQGTGGLIGDNVIDDNAGFGIHLYPDADDVLVTQNTVVGSGRSGIIVAGDRRSESDRNLVVNNIVAFNGELGIRSSWDGSAGSGNAVRGNLLFGNVAGNIPAGTWTAGLAISRNNRVANPRFVDRASANYRLSKGSPALDRALSAYSLARDFDGKRRPRGSRPDIGAFER